MDLVLGQGMLAAGWHAHTLSAPGKFLVSAPEHATPKRARAYLVTDDDVSRTAACYGPHRPQLDNVSRAALNLGPAAAEPVPWYLTDRSRDAQSDPDEPGGTPDGYGHHHAGRRALGRSLLGPRGRVRHRRTHAGHRHGPVHRVPLPCAAHRGRPRRPGGLGPLAGSPPGRRGSR